MSPSILLAILSLPLLSPARSQRVKPTFNCISATLQSLPLLLTVQQRGSLQRDTRDATRTRACQAAELTCRSASPADGIASAAQYRFALGPANMGRRDLQVTSGCSQRCDFRSLPLGSW